MLAKYISLKLPNIFKKVIIFFIKVIIFFIMDFIYLLWKLANQTMVQILEFHSAIHYHLIIYKYLLEQNFKFYPKVITFL